ncbi:hypothetical protein GCM10027168_33040 [Streptomyces capparidis]
MTFIPWDAKFEDVLRTCLPALTPTSTLDPGAALLGYGLDAACAARIIGQLEDTYCVTLPPGAVTPAATPVSVWEALDEAVERAFLESGIFSRM